MAKIDIKNPSEDNGLSPYGTIEFYQRAETSLSRPLVQPKSLITPKEEVEVTETKLKKVGLSTNFDSKADSQEEKRKQAFDDAMMLRWALSMNEHVADKDGNVSGSGIATFIKMAEMAGMDVTPAKNFIEKITGQPYSDFANNTADYSFKLGGFDGNSTFSRSGNGSLRDKINDAVLRKFANMDGLAYGMGSRTGANGRIDCSGFISQLANAVDRDLNGHATKLSATLNSTSEGQYINASKLIGGTGRIGKDALDRMEDTGQLKAGMVISTDKGATRSGFDSNRKYGIDHVVMTAERNGQLVVLESRSGKGVTMTDFDDWIKTKGNTTFFVTDMAKLAEATSPGLTRMASAIPNGPAPIPA